MVTIYMQPLALLNQRSSGIHETERGTKSSELYVMCVRHITFHNPLQQHFRSLCCPSPGTASGTSWMRVGKQVGEAKGVQITDKYLRQRSADMFPIDSCHPLVTKYIPAACVGIIVIIVTSIYYPIYSVYTII